MGSNSWINGQALSSGRLNRYFRWAAWAEFAAFFACMFLWYCHYLTLAGKPSPLAYLGVRILLGTIGAAAALGGILLWEGMWTFWKYRDTSSKGVKRLWFCVMALFIVFGCAAYYYLVYRPQIEGDRQESK